MEQLIQKELTANAQKILDGVSIYSPTFNQCQKEAKLFFEKTGIPSKKNENWIYTNIAKNLAPRFQTQFNAKSPLNNFVLNPSGFMLFNNGSFNRAESILPEGLSIKAPQVDINYHDVFDALNLAVTPDALTINVAKNTVIHFPITILHQADEFGVNKQISPRIHFNIDENAEVTLVEIFTSMQNDLFQYTTNAHTSFNLAPNSHVKHVKINLEAKLSTHISLTKAQVKRDAYFETFAIELGNMVSRNNIEVHLKEENAKAAVNGIFNLKDSEHSDTFSTIVHHAPHSFSEQTYKGILNNTSHGAFTGKIIILENCEGVNSNQLNKNLLLSKKAHIDTRPQLLVSTDDVKCSHGATVGELSSEEEFYLTSRGISKVKARKMLALGFAHEVLFKINSPEIFNFINSHLEKSDF
jgi:Fe-S cluster assembly protein SufD